MKETERTIKDWRHCLVARGYHEALTYTFVENANIQQLLEPDLSPLALAYPISPELGVMRTSLWAGLLQSVLYNQNGKQIEYAYLKRVNDSFQLLRAYSGRNACAVITDTDMPAQWGQPQSQVGFFRC